MIDFKDITTHFQDSNAVFGVKHLNEILYKIAGATQGKKPVSSQEKEFDGIRYINEPMRNKFIGKGLYKGSFANLKANLILYIDRTYSPKWSYKDFPLTLHEFMEHANSKEADDIDKKVFDLLVNSINKESSTLFCDMDVNASMHEILQSIKSYASETTGDWICLDIHSYVSIGKIPSLEKMMQYKYGVGVYEDLITTIVTSDRSWVEHHNDGGKTAAINKGYPVI